MTLPLLTRREVQARIKRNFGAMYSPRTIEALPIQYVIVGRCALYDPDDVDAYFTRVIHKAPRRIGNRGGFAPVTHDAAGTRARRTA